MSKVPVIVISGFLGSGKTTLLVRMLQEADALELSPAVLMNELGKQDVDGHLLQSASPDLNMAKLLDGCICCSKKSDISASVKQLIVRNPDVILIELTGVANPEEIVDALTEPSLLPYVKLHQVITVLDAEHVLEYNSIFASDRELVHTIRRQMEVADLLVLNKIDLVSDKQLKSIEKTIRKYNERSILLNTVHSQFDLNYIFTGLASRHSQPPSSLHLNKNMRFQAVKPFQATSHPSKQPASFSRIQTLSIPLEEGHIVTRRLVEHYLARWGRTLLRAKGYLRIGHKREPFLMQFAGKRVNWEPIDFQDAPYIVLIGLDLDVETIEDDWTKCLVESQASIHDS
ncbi:CobW family GTP-binding protein [Paenibacillus sp. GCM10023248]|uniref:CobW family GTP-binding protein n=1 Tax=unclassified Paenibacillus TaxID=185978 RepID=UPI00237973A2|nr:CobW family GTP-binding protein [Paenibacillus sp. MAHUQ-63]MDD9270453.1 GTP-binding protein [Paenibacillus sp. MAHUQ-63]